MALFHAAVPRDGKAGTASLRYTGHYRPDATSVASLIICRSALAIEAQRSAALHRLPIRSVLAARCALRCAPMAARSLRHLIRDTTLARLRPRPCCSIASGPCLEHGAGPHPKEHPMTNIDELKSTGLKATLPRLKILDIFQKGSQRHMTAEDVFRVLLQERTDIGLATVYRVLTQFAQAGILSRSNFESGKS